MISLINISQQTKTKFSKNKKKTPIEFNEFQIYQELNFEEDKVSNEKWNINLFNEKVKCCHLNDVDKSIEYINHYYFNSSLLNNSNISKVISEKKNIYQDNKSSLGNNSDETSNDNFNHEPLSLTVRSKCCSIANTLVESTNSLIFINNTNQDQDDEIPGIRNSELAQEIENLHLYMEEFPQIINEEILNFFLNDHHVELEFNYMNSILRSQLYSQQLNNLVTSNFNEGKENDFNYIVRSINLERNPLNFSNFNMFENINIYETQYINEQIYKIRKGLIPKDQTLIQLSENDLNRVFNSQNTINSSIFLRVNFQNNRIAMFI